MAGPQSPVSYDIMPMYPLASAPPIQSGFGHMYTQEVAGVVNLFFRDSDGIPHQITPAGNVDLQDAYDNGNQIVIDGINSLDIIGNAAVPHINLYDPSMMLVSTIKRTGTALDIDPGSGDSVRFLGDINLNNNVIHLGSDKYIQGISGVLNAIEIKAVTGDIAIDSDDDIILRNDGVNTWIIGNAKELKPLTSDSYIKMQQSRIEFRGSKQWIKGITTEMLRIHDLEINHDIQVEVTRRLEIRDSTGGLRIYDTPNTLYGDIYHNGVVLKFDGPEAFVASQNSYGFGLETLSGVPLSPPSSFNRLFAVGPSQAWFGIDDIQLMDTTGSNLVNITNKFVSAAGLGSAVSIVPGDFVFWDDQAGNLTLLFNWNGTNYGVALAIVP